VIGGPPGEDEDEDHIMVSAPGDIQQQQIRAPGPPIMMDDAPGADEGRFRKN